MTAPRPVAESSVIRAMLSLGGAGAHEAAAYPQIAQAIARAASQDPLFPDAAAGAEATAAILVAVAWRSSRLAAYTRQGPYLGLFRLRPPLHPPVQANALFLPRTAALFAVDLLRYSFSHMRSSPLADRLALFRDWGRTQASPSADGVRWSRETMALVGRITARLVRADEEAPSGWAAWSAGAPSPPLGEVEARAPAPLAEVPKAKRVRKKRAPSRGASA